MKNKRWKRYKGKEVSNLSCVKRKNRAPLCGIKFYAPISSHCHLARHLILVPPRFELIIIILHASNTQIESKFHHKCVYIFFSCSSQTCVDSKHKFNVGRMINFSVCIWERFSSGISNECHEITSRRVSFITYTLFSAAALLFIVRRHQHDKFIQTYIHIWLLKNNPTSIEWKFSVLFFLHLQVSTHKHNKKFNRVKSE